MGVSTPRTLAGARDFVLSLPERDLHLRHAPPRAVVMLADLRRVLRRFAGNAKR